MTHTRSHKTTIQATIAAFEEEVFGKEKMEWLGWSEVPSIDGSQVENWSDLKKAADEQGVGELLNSNGWPKVPLQVKNHRLFKMDEQYLQQIEALRSDSEFDKMHKEGFKLGNGAKSRVYQKILCKEERIIDEDAGVGWTLSGTGLIDYRIPEGMEATKEDMIVSFGRWFTDGHIETGADDSISYTPIGKKLFLICKRGDRSVLFESQMRDLTYFMHFVRKGPINFVDAENIKFFIPSRESFLCQPALCAHAVVTFTPRNQASLVLGWEAVDKNDASRASIALKRYAKGLQHGVIERSLKENGIAETSSWIQERDQFRDGKESGVGEHIVWIEKAGLSTTVPHSKKSHGCSRKKKRLANIKRMQPILQERKRIHDGKRTEFYSAIVCSCFPIIFT